MASEKSSQTVANQKWESKNREYANYLKSRSSARSFIKNKATLEDLEEFKKLITEREQLLKWLVQKISLGNYPRLIFYHAIINLNHL